MAPMTISVTVADAVATILLDRPRQANALNRTMWDELREAFGEIDANPAVRVAVLAGSGQHFCAGIDISMLASIRGMAPADRCAGRAREDLRRYVLNLQDVFSSIERCRIPVLAAVHGACIGAGLDMIAACDLRYATADARFAVKEVDLGLAADVGVLQRLPHLIGDGRTRELAYTARDILGSEAARIGLLNDCFVDRDTLMQQVMTVARALATKSPLAMRGTKYAITYARDHSVTDGLEQIATWNSATLISDDLTEAVTAASEGRSAVFGN